MKIEIVDSNSPHLAAVKKLGRENAYTLGFLPEGAFDERAQKKQIVAAIDENERCVGYLLYRIANRKAKIVHLCIDESSRCKGVARVLIENLKLTTKDLLGISLKCRRDYEATKVWKKFGFIPIGESKGRGKEAKTLIYWWLNHGHPTLFDISVEENNKEKINIVVDANVFFDFDDESRDGFVESNSLKADWLEDSLNICLVDEIYQEINRNEDATIRLASREKAAQFSLLSCNKTKAQTIYKEIEGFFPKDKSRLTDRDRSDIQQVSEAICSDVQYFVTRDNFLLKRISDKVFNQFGVKIIRPSDLIIQIDEIRRESEYQPARLSGTEIKMTLVKGGQVDDLTNAFQYREPKAHFQKNFRSYLSKPEIFTCFQIIDENHKLLALIVYGNLEQSILEVPLFRISKNKLSATLVRHLILKAIHDSLSKGKTSIRFKDEFLDNEIKTALVDEGFIETHEGWVKFHIKLVATKAEIPQELKQITIKTKDEEAFLNNISDILNKSYFELDAQIFADIEKSLYPIKISDALLPCFIIPIQPQWAKELFDEELANQGLFRAKRDLALRKEQIYYRSKLNPGGLKSPARVLWYVSQGKTNYVDVGAIRACSMIDEILIDKPKSIYKSFKRLGIYEWKHVYTLAKNNIDNEIMAIRFSHTQLFQKPVKFETLKRTLESYNCKSRLQSPAQISQDAFIEIYKKGFIDIKNDE